MVKEVTGGTSPFSRPALSVPNIFFGKIRCSMVFLDVLNFDWMFNGFLMFLVENIRKPKEIQ